MKPLVKPTTFSVRHSTVLDALVTHNSGHVRVAAAVFVTTMKPPAHASRLNQSFDRLLLGFDVFEQL